MTKNGFSLEEVEKVTNLDQNIIKEFIEKNEGNVLNALSLFLQENEYIENIDKTLDIIENNPILLKEINNLIGNVKEIRTCDLNKIAKNKMMKHLIEVYMLKKDIVEVESEEKEDDFIKSLEKSISAYAYYKMDMNMRDCSVLSKEEEILLAKQYKNGDLKAKEELVIHNLCFVIKLASMKAKKMNRDDYFEDFLQEGNKGLLKAVEKYDYKRGYKFSTYAWYWIKQVIEEATFYKKTIKEPRQTENNLKKIKDDEFEYMKLYGIKPTLEDICKKFKWSLEKIEDI